MRPSTKILYFAWLKDHTGTGEEDCDLPPQVADVASLIVWLCARGPGHAAAFATPGLVRAAVNQVFARPETPVRAGDEVAFFPPVTGG